MSDPPTQTAVHELMRMVMEQSKERNKILIDAMSKLNEGRQFSILPDLKQNIKSFDGESSDCMVAEERLNSIDVTSNLHYWPN